MTKYRLLNYDHFYACMILSSALCSIIISIQWHQPACSMAAVGRDSLDGGFSVSYHTLSTAGVCVPRWSGPENLSDEQEANSSISIIYYNLKA